LGNLNGIVEKRFASHISKSWAVQNQKSKQTKSSVQAFKPEQNKEKQISNANRIKSFRSSSSLPVQTKQSIQEQQI
jgi:hypothetical protein